MTSFTKRQRLLLIFLSLPFFVCLLSPRAFAMHIMEGYLPPLHSALWAALSLPFLAGSLMQIKRTLRRQPKALLLLAMSGAFIFVISSLKLPSVSGSSSHMTGTGLAAILFGPLHGVALGMIVLLFQALLLAHGGITTLGANTFSMAVAGPFVAWGIFWLGQRLRLNRKLVIFFAAAAGDLFTYCATSFQLAAAYPAAQGGIGASLGKFLTVFAPTQLPLAIVEGLLTVLIVVGLESYALPELKEIGFAKECA